MASASLFLSKPHTVGLSDDLFVMFAMLWAELERQSRSSKKLRHREEVSEQPEKLFYFHSWWGKFSN